MSGTGLLPPDGGASTPRTPPRKRALRSVAAVVLAAAMGAAAAAYGQTAVRGHIHFQIGDGSWHATNTDAQVPLNQWVQIVAVRGANQDARVYYNGERQPSTSYPWDGAITYSGAAFDVGQQRDQWNRFFNGRIDRVAIYDRALSDAEIGGLSGRTKPMHKPF